jgi:peptidoglycan/xylan/chitin deacetylase (PgdA/CDA1 family)
MFMMTMSRLQLRDSLVLLAVVLEQQTELNPTEIMTDTGAYTDVVFGLFRLLGYRFSPRIADMGNSRLWRIESRLRPVEWGFTAQNQHRFDCTALGRRASARWVIETWPGSGDLNNEDPPGWRPPDQVGTSRGRDRPRRQDDPYSDVDR